MNSVYYSVLALQWKLHNGSVIRTQRTVAIRDHNRDFYK